MHGAPEEQMKPSAEPLSQAAGAKVQLAAPLGQDAV
jgi:hypothetical protein